METNKVQLDASDMIAEMSKMNAVLQQHVGSLQNVAATYVKFNKESEAARVGFKGIAESGERVEGFLKRVGADWDPVITKISAAARVTKELKSAQDTLAGSQNASKFMQSVGIDTTGMSASILTASNKARNELAKALGADPANIEIAKRIFDELRSGVEKTRVDIEGKIQNALLKVLGVSEKIAAVQANAIKSNTPVAPTGPAGMTQADLSSARGLTASTYKIDTSASLSSIASYQASINALIATVSRSKISLAEFQSLLSNVSRNPTQDFAGQNQNLAQVQQGIQRVKIAYDSMKASATSAGDAGNKSARSLFVSFEQFVKLLEVQIIHRFFGNLITQTQSAIAKAAELHVKISEVLTISGGSGMDHGQMAQMIRGWSEEFNRPQADVTEGLYQAFSNQVIRTSSDLEVMTQALRLSRITVSSVADSVNLLSSVMRSYGLTNIEAKDTVDALFKAVELGRFRVADIADTIGRISVIGSQLGVARNELLAITSHLSVTGLRPSETETQVSAVLNAFMKPSQKLKEVLRSWGFESGEAALRVLTLTGAIQKLNEEVMSGRVSLSDVSPNIRSMRGMVGARDIDEIRRIRSEIDNAGPSADAANEIIQSSFGTKFQQELLKTQNLMLAFGNTAIKEINKLTEPWGGLAKMIDQVGGAVAGTTSGLLVLVEASNSVLGVVRLLNGDLGTLVKLWIGYKASVMAVTTATSIKSSMDAMIVSIQLEKMSRIQNVVAVQSEFIAKMTSASATTTESGAVIANSIAKNANTAATGSMTVATYAAVIGQRALTVAMAATPYVAVGLGLAILTGQLDPLIEKLDGTKKRLEEIASASERTRDLIARADRIQSDSVRARERRFSNTLEETQRAGGAVFQELTLRVNSLVDAQKDALTRAAEAVKVAFRTVTDEVSKRISDLTTKINEAQNSIRSSIRHAMSFADRDASDNFRRSFDALSRRPEFISPIDANNGQEYVRENTRFQIESEQFAMQRQLIQQRINRLIEEANDLVARGDEESMQSARRKATEIRHLTEQSFQLQTDFNRRTQEHNVLIGQGAAGPGGVLRYIVPVQQLQRELQALTNRENEWEEAFRARQTARAAEAEKLRVAARQQQEALNLAIRSMEQLRVLNNQNELEPRYRGANALGRFNEDYASRVQAIQTAMENAQVSPEARMQIQTTLMQQYGIFRTQIERENAALAMRNEQNLFNQRMENIQRLRAEANRSQTEYTESRTRILNAQNEQIRAMQTRVSESFTIADRLDPRLTGHTIRETDSRRNEFNSSLTELNNARTRYSSSIGTAEEAASLTRLSNAIETTSNAYRRLFGYIAENHPGRRGGSNAIEGERQLGIETGMTQLRSLSQSNARTQQQLTEGEASLNTLRGQIAQTQINLGLAAQGLNVFGGALAQQEPGLRTFTDTIGRLVDSLERLGRIPPINLGEGAGVGGGFAQGGLIGNSFNSFGPDNMLASVRTGEFVINPDSTRRFYSQLVAINAGRMPSFARGGPVGSSVTNVGDISINVHDSGNPNATARAVLSVLRREYRRGNGGL